MIRGRCGQVPSGNVPMAQEVALIYACSSGRPESDAVSLQATGSKCPVVSRSWRPGSDCSHTAGMRPHWRPKDRGARLANWCLFCMAAQMAENPKGNEPMARAVVLIFAISEVLLDLSSTSRPLASWAPWRGTGQAQIRDIEPDRLLQEQATLGSPNQNYQVLPLCSSNGSVTSRSWGQDLIVATRQV
jgi:hypothetical protein